MSEYVRAEALVDAGWVVQHLDDPNVRLVEVDEDTTAYERGHIRNPRLRQPMPSWPRTRRRTPAASSPSSTYVLAAS